MGVTSFTAADLKVAEAGGRSRAPAPQNGEHGCRPMIEPLQLSRAALDAWRGEMVRLEDITVHVPGTWRERLSMILGNRRIHRLLDRFVRPGATVIDVGANIGYNTIRAAWRAGSGGRVFAVEPTPDTLAVLRHNIAASGLTNVCISPVAAGSLAGTQDFFVRGARSAVNSLFPDSRYASVTSVMRVPVLRLDDLVGAAADVVKIDVEGAELGVLEGMPRILGLPGVTLIVEWDPLLQQMAGHRADALPHWLLNRGWLLTAVSHLSARPLTAATVPEFTDRLMQVQRPVELLARRDIDRSDPQTPKPLVTRAHGKGAFSTTRARVGSHGPMLARRNPMTRCGAPLF